MIRNILREVASEFDPGLLRLILLQQAEIATKKGGSSREKTLAAKLIIDAIYKGTGDVGQEPQRHVVYTPEQIQGMSDAQLEECYRKLTNK